MLPLKAKVLRIEICTDLCVPVERTVARDRCLTLREQPPMPQMLLLLS